jgi:hypothetical protein
VKIRALSALVALCALLLVVATAPADVSAAAAVRTVSIQVPSATTTGASVAVRGTLSRTPKGSPVVIQRKVGTRWVAVASTRTTTAKGAFTTRFRAPLTGGTHRYRADAPRKGTLRRAVSTPRTTLVRVQVRASLSASNLTPVNGGAVTMSGTVAPWLAGTPVVLQRRVGTNPTWATTTTLRPDAGGRYRHSLVPLASATTRYRTVVTARGYRTSAVSPAVTVTAVTTEPDGPAPVAGLRISSTADRVALGWTNPAGTTGVTVRRATGTVPPATATSGTAIPTNNLTGATDTKALTGETYAYSVFATAAGAASAPVSATRPGPPPASDAWVTKVPGKITFHWTNPAGVARVIVAVNLTGGVPLGPHPSPPPGTDIGTASTHTVSGLGSRQIVGLTIYTLDAAGNYRGEYHVTEVSLDGTDVAPAPISAPTTETHPHSVTLRWTDPEPSASTGIAIARVEGLVPPATPRSGWVVGRVDGGTPTTDDMVEPGRTYTYGFWAVDASGNHSTRVALTVTTPRGSPPGPVTGLSATALQPTGSPGSTGHDPQQVRLRWTSPPGAEAVVVTRGNGPTAPSSPVENGGWNLPLPADSLLDDTLAADTVYTYAVWAVGEDGSFSSVAATTVRSDPNPARTVRGRVVDSRTGAAVGTVPLTFLSDTDVHGTERATYATTSRIDGTYDIALPVGPYTVCVEGTTVTGVSPQGYVTSCSQVMVGSSATTSRDLTIHRAVAIRGVVTDASTDQPLAGATVIASRPYPNLWPAIVTTTDQDGRYLVKGVSALESPLTWVRVDASTATNGAAQGYAPDQPVSMVATPTPGETVQQDIGIEPRRLVTISGRVTTTLGASVPGVGVHLVDERGVGDGTPLAFTGADGRYTLTTALGADETRGVCFDAERHRTPGAATGFSNQCAGGADFDPEPPEDEYDESAFGTTTQYSTSSTVDVVLVRTSSVSGTVTAVGGAPLAGVAVTVRKHRGELHRTATTGADGRFTVPVGAPPTGGAVAVTVCASTAAATGGPSAGGYVSPLCQDRSMSSTAPTTGLGFVAPPAAVIEGKVADLVSGVPLAGMVVQLEQQSAGVTHASDRTTAAGTYSLTQITPEAGRTYRVCALGPDHGRTCRTLAELGIPALTVGSRHQATPLLAAELGSISGVLTGADTGEPITDVVVTLRGESGDDRAVTDARGRYSFDELPPGRYAVAADPNTAGPRGYRTTGTDGFTIVVPAGQNAVADLAMRAAAAVRVIVVTPDGRPAPGVTLSLRGDLGFLNVRTGADGRAVVKGLAASDVPVPDGVCANLGGVGPGTRAGYTKGCGLMPTLTPGTTASTTVVVGLGSAFGARVHDAATGEPVAGARVALSVPYSNYFPTHYADTGPHGFAFPITAIHAPDIAGLNPARPRDESARICVQAGNHESACFRGGAEDGQSGPLMTGRPGMLTIATFALTPSSP